MNIKTPAEESSEVSLEEMLSARERRVAIQQELIKAFGLPLISFTMNIPGPVKILPLIPSAFERGCSEIETALSSKEIPVSAKKIIKDKTGFEAFYCADARPRILKDIAIRLEDESEAGRLYDIDIICQNGEKVSREELGHPARACLLCGEPAHVCGRSRRHAVEELVEKIQEILERV